MSFKVCHLHSKMVASWWGVVLLGLLLLLLPFTISVGHSEDGFKLASPVNCEIGVRVFSSKLCRS